MLIYNIDLCIQFTELHKHRYNYYIYKIYMYNNYDIHVY